MKLTDTCIRKPVLAIVISLAMVVLGCMFYSRLQVRFFPKFVMPVVNVSTTYTGANAKVMENQVTTIIENYLAGIDNIKYMYSSSWQSRSSIDVYFPLGSDLQSEAAQVRDKVAAAIKTLPDAVDHPVITVGTRGQSLLYYGFEANNKTPTEIREYVAANITPLLNQVRGVGQVFLIGGADYAMRVWLDPAKMVGYGVTVTDVKNALTANNIYFAAGQVRESNRLYSIVTDTQLKTPADFAKIIVKQSANGTVRFSDIAKVELGFSTFEATASRVNGNNAVIMGIKPLQTANAISVAKRIRQQMTLIRSKLPPGMQVHLVYDNAKFLQSSISETYFAIAEAIFLVVVVIYLFLGSVRAALIPIVTIPVCLIAVFALISLFGFTINILTLLGMLLAIGLVVDDAIVMLENIHRYIEQGMAPLQAAFQGAKEISSAVVAMTIVLVAVYAPIGFIQGVSAELFKEFAFTLAAAVSISGFVALTLSPMMSAKVLPGKKQESRFSHWLERIFDATAGYYKHALQLALKHRAMIVVVMIAVAGLGVVFFKAIPSEFIPKEDYGLVMINISSPFTATVAYNDKYVKQIGDMARKIPAVETVYEQTDDSSAHITLVLKPWTERKLTSQAVVKLLNKQLAAIPGVDASATVPDIINYGAKTADIDLNFITAKSYHDLLAPMQKMAAILKKYPGVVNVNNNLKFDTQEYAITVRRDLAAELGVSLQTIADTVSTMMGSAHWTDVQSGSRSYPVLVQMQKQDFTNPSAIKELYVTSSRATNNASSMVPLSSLVSMKPIISQGTLYHYNRLHAGVISATLASGYTESQVLKYIQSQLPSVLTPSVHVAYSGKAEEYIESSGSMTTILLLSFIFIYLVLAAQFGSFIDPFIILLAVPLSLVGGLVALWLGGGTLNLYSEIGLVTLVGMISKHGILITQFANTLRQEGVELSIAIVQAAQTRLRPILMTTAAMVFGSLPLAFASGPGSVGRHAIGCVIVGGLLAGTFFSLIVVPIAYSYIAQLRRHR